MKQYDIYWTDLEPTVGSEINKVRPAVIISPDELNRHLSTVIIAPLTTAIRPYHFRVNCLVDNKRGSIALDQIRTIDKIRLQRLIGQLNFFTINEIKNILKEMLID